MEDELLGRQSAIAEAHALYRMIGHGSNTVEALRELIAVPPLIERVLRAFARAYPEEAHSIDKSIEFCSESRKRSLPRIEGGRRRLANAAEGDEARFKKQLFSEPSRTPYESYQESATYGQRYKGVFGTGGITAGSNDPNTHWERLHPARYPM